MHFLQVTALTLLAETAGVGVLACLLYGYWKVMTNNKR